MATDRKPMTYQFAHLRRSPQDHTTRSVIAVAMPLVKREIEPVHLSRGIISQGISNELECVTNTTLAGIIKQLSNISKHAEDIFGDLYNEAHSLCRRSNSLQDRIDRLSVKVKQLDATRDDVQLTQLLDVQQFRASTITDVVTLDLSTMQLGMKEIYLRCDPPPNLNVLSKYREDGKEALKFYTDPKYFFQLWCEEMQKNITDIREKKNRKKKRHAGKNSKSTSKPSEIRTRKKEWQAMAGGKEFMPDKTPSATPTSETREQLGSDWSSSHGSNHNIEQYQQQAPPQQHQQIQQQHGNMSRSSSEGFDEVGSYDSGVNRRETKRPKSRPPPPPSNETTPEYEVPPVVNGTVHVPKRPAPIAPPQQKRNNHMPPHQQQPQHVPVGQTIIPPAPLIDNRQPMMNNIANHAPPELAMPPPPPVMNSNVPPPPPPPPLPPLSISQGMPIPPPPNVPAPNPKMISSSPPQGGEVPETSSPGNPASPRKTSMRPAPKVDNTRNNLLTAIQQGINLRKVEIQEERARHQTPVPNSVEAILARRIAVELSDSESEGSDDDDDDEDWD